MMQYIIYFIVLLLGFWVFRLTRPQKLAWLLVASICFWEFRFPLPLFRTAPSFWVLCVILSELKNAGRVWRCAKSTLIAGLAGLSMVSFVILYFNSPHYSGSIWQFVRLFCHEQISQYFLPVYAFYCIRKEEDMAVSVTWTRRAMYVLTAFALVNLATRYAFAIDILKPDLSAYGVKQGGSFYAESDRFRVQALFFNAFGYGYICLMMFFLHLYARIRGLETRKQSLCVMACGVFGILTCECRTLVVCWIIALPLFILSNYPIGRWLRYGVSALLLLVLSLEFVPYMHKKAEQTVSVLDADSEGVLGSSIDMREKQFLSVMYHIREHPQFGRGADFFILDKGWQTRDEKLMDRDLFGLEGVYLEYLLERGFVGYGLYLCFYLSLMTYFIRNRHCAKTQCSVSIAILTSYLLFAHFTGELNSPYPTLLLCGALVSVIEVAKITPPTNVKQR